MVKKAKQWLNLPDLSRVTNINLSAQTMELQHSGNSFAFWLNLATLEKGKRVLLPLTRNSYLENELKKGKLNKQVQVKFKEDGTIAVSPIIEQETTKLRTEGEALGLDWGMVNLFTTSDGRRLGGKMLQKLRIYDKLLMQIQAELQQSNQSLKRNPEYQGLQSKIRSFVKNEIGRILNNLAKEDLKELVVEKLNFAGGGMSRSMNRRLTRAGRKALRVKLARLNEEQGVMTTEVQAAYTSQICARCGYTDKKNRQSQAKFKCQCCGHTCNADVNAAFNILQRRSLKISLSNRSDKRKTLKERILDVHSKMCPSGKHLSMTSL
jgi:putative transposase